MTVRDRILDALIVAYLVLGIIVFAVIIVATIFSVLGGPNA